jgi:hypothetical protein
MCTRRHGRTPGARHARRVPRCSTRAELRRVDALLFVKGVLGVGDGNGYRMARALVPCPPPGVKGRYERPLRLPLLRLSLGLRPPLDPGLRAPDGLNMEAPTTGRNHWCRCQLRVRVGVAVDIDTNQDTVKSGVSAFMARSVLSDLRICPSERAQTPDTPFMARSVHSDLRICPSKRAQTSDG